MDARGAVDFEKKMEDSAARPGAETPQISAEKKSYRVRFLLTENDVTDNKKT